MSVDISKSVDNNPFFSLNQFFSNRSFEFHHNSIFLTQREKSLTFKVEKRLKFVL